MYFSTTPSKNYGIDTLRGYSPCFVLFFYYLAVNKLMIDKTQNISHIVAEHFDLIKHFLNKLDQMV